MIMSRYILRALAGPFFFSLSTLMFIFLLQFVMKFIDQLVGKGLSAWVIMELVALNLAWMLVLAVPMSVLVAVLMAFGDLSSKNEITAMKASGISLYRMMAPVLLAGICVGGLLVWFNNDVLPESNHRLKALRLVILNPMSSVLYQFDPNVRVKTLQFSCRLKGIDASISNDK